MSQSHPSMTGLQIKAGGEGNIRGGGGLKTDEIPIPRVWPLLRILFKHSERLPFVLLFSRFRVQ